MHIISNAIPGRAALALVAFGWMPALAADPQSPAAPAVRQAGGDPPPPIAPATVSRDEAGHATVRAVGLDQPLRMDGRLDEDQRKRLIEIADKCPVHRTLTSEIDIRTTERTTARPGKARRSSWAVRMARPTIRGALTHVNSSEFHKATPK